MSDGTPMGDEGALILASASPRRSELLSRVGVQHEVLPSRVSERARHGEVPDAYAARLATEKAGEVASRTPGAFVLGADTVVEEGGEAFGKAADAAGARQMLARLSGRRHRVTTAVALCGPEVSASLAVTTEVSMRALPEAETDAYIEAGEWRGKAGAYAIQGMAAAFVTEVRGSVTNVIGLPLAEVLELLERSGAPGPHYREGVPV